MSFCICCKQETSTEEVLLEVRTLHIRDFTGERKIQALGSFVYGSVCDPCARAGCTALLSPGRSILAQAAGFFALTLTGGILFYVLSEFPLRVPAACAMLLGFLGAIHKAQTMLARKKYIGALPPEQALAEVRLRILKDRLPHKEAENNLTYISLPVLLSADPGTLTAQYGLLPPIAQEAVDRGKEYAL